MRSRRGFMLFAAAAATAVAVVSRRPGVRSRAARLEGVGEGARRADADLRGEDALVGKSGWSARVSVHNLSHRIVRIGNVFALTFYKGAKITPTTRADAFGQATRSRRDGPRRSRRARRGAA